MKSAMERPARTVMCFLSSDPPSPDHAGAAGWLASNLAASVSLLPVRVKNFEASMCNGRARPSLFCPNCRKPGTLVI